MDEVVMLRFNADLTESKVGIRAIHARVFRTLHIKISDGRHRHKNDIVLAVSVDSFPRATVSAEDVVAKLDMNEAAAFDTPENVLNELDDFGGKAIQQTREGKMIK